MVHLFVVKSCQGTGEGSEKLQLTDKLLQVVLAEAQVVCIGFPLLIAGDFTVDPAVITRLAKGISAGRFVNLALAYSFGAGSKRDATCKFRLDECSGSRGDSIVGCANADRWFTHHSLCSRASV